MGSDRVLHKMQYLKSPDPNEVHFKKLMEGLSKTCKKPVRQASVMNYDVLRQLFYHVDFNIELEAVTWCAVLVGFILILQVF